MLASSLFRQRADRCLSGCCHTSCLPQLRVWSRPDLEEQLEGCWASRSKLHSCWASVLAKLWYAYGGHSGTGSWL